jgi:YHS domain-containing protein
MKSCFESIWKSGRPVIFGIIVLLSASVIALTHSPAQDSVPVLEGLDPVMLVQGKEVQGDLKVTVTRGKFQYLFASAENKATFEKDSARYEIQMDGACARMGSPVIGNPDLYTVYKGRIYIFGTGECKKRFEEAPENYLEDESSARPKAGFTAEALTKGQSLIEKAVAAMGGAARIDGLTSYQEKSTALQTRRQGDVEVKTDLTILFPDRIRSDRTMPDWNDPSTLRQMTIVVAPGEVFGTMGSAVRSLPDSARIEQEKEIKRRPLSILRARKSVNPVVSGSGKAGETAVEQVAVEIDHASYTLGIDPATGRILSLSTRRRGPQGNFGEFVQSFSDFRTVGSLILPFKITATFNGQPWKEQSPTIEAITLNGKIDPALFEKPKTKTQ